MSDKLYDIQVDSCGYYEVYTRAIIQCESKEVLEQLLENKDFDNYFNGKIDRSRASFCVMPYQNILAIEHVGNAVLERKDGVAAIILCSDYKGG